MKKCVQFYPNLEVTLCLEEHVFLIVHAFLILNTKIIFFLY